MSITNRGDGLLDSAEKSWIFVCNYTFKPFHMYKTKSEIRISSAHQNIMYHEMLIEAAPSANTYRVRFS